MKLYYYTLAQSIDLGKGRIHNYLRDRNIDYRSGVERWDELWIISGDRPKADRMAWIYIALLDESDLSAIRLSFDDIVVVRNRFDIELKNKFRRLFRWFL
jgi:hypothetical protein